MRTETFCSRLTPAANHRPQQIAMTLLGTAAVESTTFGEMLSQIRSLAYRLEKEGIELGDRVAIIGENHPQWAIAYLGILYRGAVVVPLDPSSPAETLATFLKNSEARLAFVSSSALEKFRAVEQLMPYAVRSVQLQSTCGSDFCDWTATPRTAKFDNAIPPPSGE